LLSRTKNIKYISHISIALTLIFASGCSNKFDENNREEPVIKSKFDKMTPYEINGKWYYPKKEPLGSKFKGIASWYGEDYHGKKTANGEVFNMYSKTAAHKTLPMNTMLFVKNIDNSKSTIVRVNDRGPFVDGREIDLSKKSASEIELVKSGSVEAEITVLGYDGLIDDDILRKAQMNSDSHTTNTNNSKTKKNQEDDDSGIISNSFDGLGIIDDSEKTTGKVSNVIVSPRNDEEIEILDAGSRVRYDQEDFIPVSNSKNNKKTSKKQPQTSNQYYASKTNRPKTSDNSLTGTGGGKQYYIQVVTSSNPDGITKFIAENERKLPSHLRFIRKEDGGKIKVWVEGFENIQEARDFKDKKEYFPDGMLVIR
jgi:rare lipoprotein A